MGIFGETVNGIHEKMTGPYDDLYVYYLNGVVDDGDSEKLGESFLGNWVEDDSSFLFFSKKSDETITELLKRDPGLRLFDTYYFTYEQWYGRKKSTLRIDRFVITPPWAEAEVAKGDIRIVLDPGVVFGDGFHPTTYSCLRSMLYLRDIAPFDRVMDIGTGTGILAISAAALGAERVLALDLNPLAVKTALRNVKLNGFDRVIEVVKGRAENFNLSGDLTIANIHYEVLRHLFEREKFLENKWFIVSGLMRSQASEFRDRIKGRGLEVDREWDHEMTWYTFLLKNKKKRLKA